jgi:hypothetical protein
VATVSRTWSDLAHGGPPAPVVRANLWRRRCVQVAVLRLGAAARLRSGRNLTWRNFTDCEDPYSLVPVAMGTCAGSGPARPAAR